MPRRTTTGNTAALVATLLASLAGLAVLAALGVAAVVLIGVGYVVIGFSGGGVIGVENRGAVVEGVRYDDTTRTVTATLIGRRPGHRPEDANRPLVVTLTLTGQENEGGTRSVLEAGSPPLAPGERAVVTFSVTAEQARLLADPTTRKTVAVKCDSGQLVVKDMPWPAEQK